MKRPSLSLGIAILLFTPLFLLEKTVVFIAVVFASVAVLCFYIFTKNKSIKGYLIIPVICIFSLLFTGNFLLNQALVKDKALSLTNSECDLVAYVSELPENIKNYDTTRYTLKITSVNGEKANIKLGFTTTAETDYKLYDILFIKSADLKSNDNIYYNSEKIFISLSNQELLEKIGEKNKDFYYHCLNVKQICINKLSEYLYNDEFGIITGLFFGGTSDISAKTNYAFKTSGITHILSVSGLHTSLWCGLAIGVLALLKTDRKKANILCLIILVALSIVSGFTPPVLRSVFMMSVILLAPFFKRQPDSLNSLGIAIIILLIINPYTMYSSSFILSVLATAGVILSTKANVYINPLINKINNRFLKFIVKHISASFAVSLFATLFTLPAIVYYFGSVSIIAPLTNLLTVELTFIIMIVALIALLLAFIPFSPFVIFAELLFEATSLLLKLLLTIVYTLGNLKYSSIPVNPRIAFVAIFISLTAFLIYNYILKPRLLKPFLRRVFISLIILPLTTSLILSLLPIALNSEITILPSSANANAIIRTGTHYAVINLPNNIEYDSYNKLPKTISESVDLLIITHLNKTSAITEANFSEEYKPKETLISDFIYDNKNNFNNQSFDFARIIDKKAYYSLGNKINIEIFDTYGLNCAIIEFNGKTVVLSFSKYNDFKEIEQISGEIDILVLPDEIPESFNIFVDTIVLTSTDENIFSETEYIARMSCNNFYRTSEIGEFHIY